MRPPVSQASVSGPQGINGWFTGNVTVSLSATDDNSGILQTKYSLDGGATFLNYIAPVVISQEGATEFTYFSIDKAGNDEAQKILQLKIDKNIPEISLMFDLASENFVWSQSNPSTVSFSCTTILCTATSRSGTQTIVSFLKIVSGSNITTQLYYVSYNGIKTTFPKSVFTVHLGDKQGIFRDFDQTFSVQDAERLKINYFYHKDESNVTATVSNMKLTKQVFTGKEFLRLNTNQGKINSVLN